ncbi:MAG TPA: PAS domain S-box protein [Candidatus Acidoferrum sp.]|jgi:two-component system cell cycle sensor histidine kinase/response regulator CckA|nr:PAS domain S-box protein [Candidatus Acidoferrum sp.]
MTEIGDHTRAEILERSFEAAPSALLVVNREGRIVLANQQCERLFGYTREELIGKYVETLVPAPLRELHAALRNSYVSDPGGPWMKTGRELLALRKDGTEFPAEIGLSPFRTDAGVLILNSVVDITGRKEMEAALRESEERFRMMADTAPVMFWIAGPDHLCTFFNRRWLAFTGLRMEEALGGECAKCVHPDDLEACIATRTRACEDRREFQLEYRLRRADGEYRWVLESGAPRFAPNGDFAGFVASCTDITDRRREQEEALARQKLESIGLLAGGIAHDFNNLLGSILADAELALGLVSPADGSEEIARIRAVAIRASEIVRELMIYAGQDKANPQPVDLSLLVEEMLQLLKTTITKHATITTELVRSQAIIRADAAELRQVVMNLVLNASEAIGESGEIRITTSRVKLADPAGDFVRLEVEDTGRGMSKAALTRIFDPFFTTKLSGRGLGLSVVQRIIQRYAGSIRAYSELDHGTRFVVLLPSAGEAPLVERPATVRPEEDMPGMNRTLLMVEDEEGLRLAVSKMLRKRGFVVEVAGDGAEAIALLHARGSEFDAILLDMTLPGISSHQVILEAGRICPGIKIVLTTAYSREMAVPAFEARQVKGFIRKPYQIGDLVGLLGDVLSDSRETDAVADVRCSP